MNALLTAVIEKQISEYRNKAKWHKEQEGKYKGDWQRYVEYYNNLADELEKSLDCIILNKGQDNAKNIYHTKNKEDSRKELMQALFGVI